MPDEFDNGRRSQWDAVRVADSRDRDQYGMAAVLLRADDEPGARQEFKGLVEPDAVIRRHGGNLEPPPASAFGSERDFDVDLAEAFSQIRQAEVMYAQAPKELREKFPHWSQFWRAVASGHIALRDVVEATPTPEEPAPQPAKPAPPAEPAGKGADPPASAKPS